VELYLHSSHVFMAWYFVKRRDNVMLKTEHRNVRNMSINDDDDDDDDDIKMVRLLHTDLRLKQKEIRKRY
jgi:hypothetical protein